MLVWLTSIYPLLSVKNQGLTDLRSLVINKYSFATGKCSFIQWHASASTCMLFKIFHRHQNFKNDAHDRTNKTKKRLTPRKLFVLPGPRKTSRNGSFQRGTNYGRKIPIFWPYNRDWDNARPIANGDWIVLQPGRKFGKLLFFRSNGERGIWSL